MEETKLVKVRTLNNDPQYFGGYLNMARHNIFSISNHVAKKLGNNVKELDDEEKIESSFLCDKANSKVSWELAYAITLRYFPLIKLFDYERLPEVEKSFETNTGKDFETMSDTLKLLFKELTAFRNDYSHYYSTETETARKISISDTLAEFLRRSFQMAIAYTKVRFRDVLNDFSLAEKLVIVDSNNNITQTGLAFLTCFFLDRENAFQFIGKLTGLKGTQFDSYIATREVLMTYCVKLPHDKFISDDSKQAFSLDLINELNRCPAILYNVITTEAKKKFRPALDDIGLKNLLSNSSNNLTDDIENYEEYVEALTKKVRHNDRFYDYALRFIDENNIFNSLRFQIDLGKLVINQYEKSLNGETVDRLVNENAMAFGNLSSLLDEEKVLNSIRKNNSNVIFSQFAPYYNKNMNKIGIANKESKAIVISRSIGNELKINLKQPQPEAFLSIYELPKIILLEYLKKGESESLINDFIKFNNEKLLNKEFIDEIKEKLPKEQNAFQKRVDTKKSSAYNIQNLEILLTRKKVLNEILLPYNLNDKQIPKRILNHWLDITEVSESTEISGQIKLMKRGCIERLKTLTSFRKTGKGKIPKIGEMATFLAMDIVDMVIDKDKKQKITSFYYTKMQECLALWSNPEKKSLFIAIVNNELKLYEKGGHPFLKNLDLEKIEYTSEFYEKYLQEKGYKLVKEVDNKTGRSRDVDKSWMERNFYSKEWNEKLQKQMTVVKLPVNKNNIPYSICKLGQAEYSFEEWFENIIKGRCSSDRKKPVDLPTNLFDQSLRQLLKVELKNQNVSFLSDAYFNELFKLWWDARNDGVQEFYASQREYEIYGEKLIFEPNSKQRYSEYYQKELESTFQQKTKDRNEERKTNKRLPQIQLNDIEKTFKRVLSENEKQIRITQEHDRLIILMIEELLEDGKNLNLKLKESDKLLNQTITIKQKVKAKLSFNDLGEFIKNNSKPEIERSITETRKRKDYSVLRKFVYDRRLPELFEYFDDNEIPLEKLKVELDAYNNAKQLVLSKAFELEKILINKDKESIKLLNVNNYVNIQHEPYLIWLKDKGIINQNDFTFLNIVRNTFSHNQFPQKRTVGIFLTEIKSNAFAMQISEVYMQKIDTILKKI